VASGEWTYAPPSQPAPQFLQQMSTHPLPIAESFHNFQVKIDAQQYDGFFSGIWLSSHNREIHSSQIRSFGLDLKQNFYFF